MQIIIGVFKEVKGLWDIFHGKWAAELAFTFFLNVINGLNGAEVRVCPVSSHNSERTVLLW